MSVRFPLVSATFYEHLGFATFKLSPLLLLLNPYLTIHFAHLRTATVRLRLFASRRNFPWIVVSLRTPPTFDVESLRIGLTIFGMSKTISPLVLDSSDSEGVVRLPNSQPISRIRWSLKDNASDNEVEICNSIRGDQKICVEKSEISQLSTDFDSCRIQDTNNLIELLPLIRRDLFRDPTEIWILGNSPSVDLNDLDKIAASGSAVIALNRFHLSYPKHRLREDFVISADNLVIQQFGQEISEKSNGLPIFLTSKSGRIAGQKNMLSFSLNGRTREEPLMSCRQTISAFGSSLIVAIQIALLMGFKRINLYGVDLDYDSFTLDGKSPGDTSSQHFIPDYRSGRPWNQPQWDRIMPGLMASALLAKVSGATVVNFTPGYRLRMFHKARL